MPTYSQRPRAQGKSQTPFATPLTTRPPSLSRAEHQLPRELDVVCWRVLDRCSSPIVAVPPCPLAGRRKSPRPPIQSTFAHPKSQRTPPLHGRFGSSTRRRANQLSGGVSRDTEVGGGQIRLLGCAPRQLNLGCMCGGACSSSCICIGSLPLACTAVVGACTAVTPQTQCAVHRGIHLPSMACATHATKPHYLRCPSAASSHSRPCSRRSSD